MIDNGQLGQGRVRAAQSRAEQSRHVFWTTVTLSQYGYQYGSCSSEASFPPRLLSRALSSPM